MESSGNIVENPHTVYNLHQVMTIVYKHKSFRTQLKQEHIFMYGVVQIL